jgi:polysaccharide export outer membrane protein
MMLKRRTVIGLAIALLAMASIERPALGQAENAVYRLGSGDRLRVTVFGESELSGEFQVDGAGTVAMPLIGEVRARGLTVREFEKAVTSALQDGYLRRPQVSVEVLNFRPFYILGEVQRPGSYPYVDGMTVLNAVVLAGGYTYRARTNRLTIRRANEAEEREVGDDAVVLPGDVIRIPERFF